MSDLILLLSVFLPISVVLLIFVGYVWYRAPRWLAEQSHFTEPQLSEAEAKNRTVIGQVLGVPALSFGLASAAVGLISGVQGYRESLSNSRRQDNLQLVQQSQAFNQQFGTR